MKKILIPSIVAVLALSSCKKDRTCTCTFPGSTEADKTTYTKVTKGQAKANCFSYTYSETSGGTTTSFDVTCSLD